MRIAVVGPGAMGCLFAARLGLAGHRLHLVDYRLERAQRLRHEGIRLEEPEGTHWVRLPMVVGEPEERPDVVILCVKANQTQAAGRGIACWSSAPPVLTLQNGLGNVEILKELLGPRRVMGGITSEGATLLGEGRVRHAGEGETIIGGPQELEGLLEEVVAVLGEAGFRSRLSHDVEGLIWGKLIVNVGINALAAITGVRNGRLPEIPEARCIMERAVDEALTVSFKMGVRLPYEEPFARVLEVCRMTSQNRASMLQDVLKKRPTEVDFINDAIVREGKRLGVPVPVNETLTGLIHALEAAYREESDPS